MMLHPSLQGGIHGVSPKDPGKPLTHEDIAQQRTVLFKFPMIWGVCGPGFMGVSGEIERLISLFHQTLHPLGRIPIQAGVWTTSGRLSLIVIAT